MNYLVTRDRLLNSDRSARRPLAVANRKQNIRWAEQTPVVIGCAESKAFHWVSVGYLGYTALFHWLVNGFSLGNLNLTKVFHWLINNSSQKVIYSLFSHVARI